jgi:hypothetical protein
MVEVRAPTLLERVVPVNGRDIWSVGATIGGTRHETRPCCAQRAAVGTARPPPWSVCKEQIQADVNQPNCRGADLAGHKVRTCGWWLGRRQLSDGLLELSLEFLNTALAVPRHRGSAALRDLASESQYRPHEVG